MAAYPLLNSLDDGVPSDDHAVHSPCALCPLWSTYTTQTHGSVRDTLPHTAVGVCGEFQWTGRRHTDCSRVETSPTTSLFWKGHQDASRTLEKMCWLRRGVRWRLTCASVWQLWFKKKSVPVIFEPPCNKIPRGNHTIVTLVKLGKVWHMYKFPIVSYCLMIAFYMRAGTCSLINFSLINTWRLLWWTVSRCIYFGHTMYKHAARYTHSTLHSFCICYDFMKQLNETNKEIRLVQFAFRHSHTQSGVNHRQGE